MKKGDKDVYEFLKLYIEKNGYAPSYNEIGEGIGVKSKASVYKYLQNLEDVGLIKLKPYSPRTISLVGYKLVKEGD